MHKVTAERLTRKRLRAGGRVETRNAMFALKDPAARSVVLSVFAALFLQFSLPGAGLAVDEELTLGERYHYESCLTWEGALADRHASRPEMPARHKRYPGVELIALPEPDYKGMPVEEAIKKRRSVRAYSAKPISLLQLSQLLFSAQGVTGNARGLSLRTAPSAGALYPFEVYVVANRVEGLERGIYHYVVGKHALELVISGDFRGKLSEAGLNQETLSGAAAAFVLSAVFDRTRSKYGERGFRYVYIEAGHIAQNVSLQAVSLGLGSVPVGAFLDAKVNKLIGVDGLEEAAIFILAAGKP